MASGEGMARERRDGWLRRALVICALAAIALLALLVRTPRYADPTTDPGSDPTALERYAIAYPTNRVDRSGLPFFMEQDAYYHLRMADDIAAHGSFGTPAGPEGATWDDLRHAPEGLNADYHAGIIHVAVGLWRVLGAFGVDLHTVCFWLSWPAAVLTALAAYALARRASGPLGAQGQLAGVLAALLVSCAPAFVQRTLAGTFDTDMTQLLFTIALMALVGELLQARTMRGTLVCAVAFALVAAIFTRFWSASCLAFVLVALGGGAVFVGTVALVRYGHGVRGIRRLIDWPVVGALAGAACLSLLLIVALNGPTYLQHFTYLLNNASSRTSAENLPHLFVSIAELKAPALGPAQPLDWFAGYVGGEATLINGVGGLLVALAALACLATAVVRIARASIADSGEPEPDKGIRDALAWLCVLATWLAACLYATKLGIRMVEHLTAPVGILAGLAVGMVARALSRRWRRTGAIAAVLVGTAVALPAVSGAYRIYGDARSIVTDASEESMTWVTEHAKTSDAVIASWWDLGYYYEQASGHPTLWDGGEHDPLRAIIIGKALTCTDPELGSALLRMLATSGNRPAELLCERLGSGDGCAALWELAPADRAQTLAALQEYGFAADEAGELEALLHPETPREVYLVVTQRMLHLIGWIECFGNWHFDRANVLPKEVGHTVLPDGSATIASQDPEVVAFFEHRQQELLWRLVAGDETRLGSHFELVCDSFDGVDVSRVWRVR